jgi:hypothetical protein
MITLRDTESGDTLGTISEADLEVLIQALEEESLADRDYYIQSETVDLLEQENASPELVSLLRTALAGREGVEIAWSRS